MNGLYRPELFDPENPVVYQPYAGYDPFNRIRSGPEAYQKNVWDYAPREIKMFDKLPVKIQAIAKRVLEDSLEQWTEKVAFHGACVYRPDLFFKDEVLAQSNYGLLPKYQLWFVFSFPEKRIKEYCFEMSFDQYGQVLKFDFPRYLFYLEQTLDQYERAHRLALEHVNAKNYKPGLFDLELKYSADTGWLNWKFCYLQKEVDTPEVNQKKIRTIIVDLIFNMVICDQELRASFSKIPVSLEEWTIISETNKKREKGTGSASYGD